jgi:AcrR family transcriptional regulator
LDINKRVDQSVRIPPRTRILSAAAELFSRHGIGAVSVEAIARTAASNKMTLYHHFVSKDELVAAYLRESAKEADALWARIQSTCSAGTAAQLSAWLAEMGQGLIDGSGSRFTKAAVELWEKSRHSACFEHEDKVHADDEAVASQVEEQFGDLCSRSNVSCEFRRIRWEQPAEEAILNALHSDLVIVGHPWPNGLPGDVALETIFLAGGAPLLVLPNAWQGKAIGDNVLIAWNASREVRRTAFDAMTFLVAAQAVTVLLVDPGKRHRHGEEPGAEIALQLVRHGAHVDVDRVTSNGSSIAQVILRYAMQSGSDLLVFGPYSHARLRERLLGGTTRTLLAQMPVPVLVSR